MDDDDGFPELIALTLVSEPGWGDRAIRLRRALKALKRQYGWRVVEIEPAVEVPPAEEVTQPEQEADRV